MTTFTPGFVFRVRYESWLEGSMGPCVGTYQEKIIGYYLTSKLAQSQIPESYYSSDSRYELRELPAMISPNKSFFLVSDLKYVTDK